METEAHLAVEAAFGTFGDHFFLESLSFLGLYP